jgi:hypothetical protein
VNRDGVALGVVIGLDDDPHPESRQVTLGVIGFVVCGADPDRC